MNKTPPEIRPVFRVPATREELRRILGELDEALVAEILALRPTVSELEEVAQRAAGQTAPRPAAGVVAELVAILSASEEDKQRR